MNPGQLAKPTELQSLECILSAAVITVLKYQHVYRFKYPPATPDGQRWDGGISWWKLCSDPDRPPSLSVPTDTPHARLNRTALPTFNAMADPPRPPQVNYELEMVPPVLSLANLEAIKVVLKVCLHETIPYTVLGHKSMAHGPGGTALVETRIDGRDFDIFDKDTVVTISRQPRYATSMWTPGMSRAPMYREQLRVLTPGQTCSGQCEPPNQTDLLKWFTESFRIDNVSTLVGRKLGLRLRTVQTFWTTKGIDELFGEAETVRREYWYVPLMTESPAVANFCVEP